MSTDVNCYSQYPGQPKPYEAIDLKTLPTAENKPAQMGMLMGGTIGKRLIRGTKMFPVDWQSGKLPGVRNSKIFSASIYPANDTAGELVVGARSNPDEAYYFGHTGLKPWNLTGDLMQLWADAGGPERFTSRPHGFVVAHGSLAAKLAGVDVADLGPDAQEVWHIEGLGGKRLGLGKEPPYTYWLGRLVKHSVVLRGDMTGGCIALIGLGGGDIRVVDASGQRDEFDELLEASRKAAKAA